jgi:sodium/bile acid cotransporter 7
MLFLCCLPSTVQSSIAFTSIGRGNVAAAVCAASASNLLGIFLTPVLVGLLMHAHGERRRLGVDQDIVIQLLLPFVAGQLVRPWVGPSGSRSTRPWSAGSIAARSCWWSIRPSAPP